MTPHSSVPVRYEFWATSGPGSVYAGDLDGHGDVDVLSASDGNSKIALYENEGNAIIMLSREFETESRGGSRRIEDVWFEQLARKPQICRIRPH